jgi:creatinine amidohydrolase
MTYADTRDTRFDTAVLPLGATEPHNLHLPYATDTLEGSMIGRAICSRAVELGARVVLLPTIPYGTETNMRFLPLAMNVNPSTLYALITDLVKSVQASGIRRLVILNSHGGNEIKPLLRELAGKTEVHLFLCDWFRTFHDCYHELFSAKEDHAGEVETSLIMHYFPHLVRTNTDGSLFADAGETRSSRFEALNRGWVSITRRWDLLTTNTGSGNPHAASAEKGARLVALLQDRLGQFLAEVSKSPLDEHFPFAD